MALDTFHGIPDAFTAYQKREWIYFLKSLFAGGERSCAIFYLKFKAGLNYGFKSIPGVNIRFNESKLSFVIQMVRNWFCHPNLNAYTNCAVPYSSIFDKYCAAVFLIFRVTGKPRSCFVIIGRRNYISLASKFHIQ